MMDVFDESADNDSSAVAVPHESKTEAEAQAEVHTSSTQLGLERDVSIQSTFDATPTEDVPMTPVVRHLLKEAGLTATDVKGTGNGGRITKEDVEQQLTILRRRKAKLSAQHHPSGAIASAKDTVVSLSPSERHMFDVMTQSLTIPHFLFTHTVDVTDLNKIRREGNWATSTKLTLLPFITKALSQVMIEQPKLNAHVDASDPPNPCLIIRSSHNFGFAVDTPKGLLVPVIRNVQDQSISSLAQEIQRLSHLALSGRLTPADYQGGTFNISNIGSIGGDVIAPLIVAPMVGIVGIGRVTETPVLMRNEGGTEQIVKRERVVLSWSADHRVLDGATVAKAAKALEEVFSNAEERLLS